MKEWRSLASLVSSGDDAPVALVGAPVALGSVTPGACNAAPAAMRAAMARTGTYDIETETEIDVALRDAGDLDLAGLSPAESFTPLREGVTALAARHDLTVILGGNNAITRGGVHALGDLETTGLITFDAHFDMRDTSAGLTNGNPVQALLDDGMPGRNIAQIGLAPFANARYMHEAAKAAGNRIVTMAELRRRGVETVLDEVLADLGGRCARLYADFDIDVIERGLAPGAPGARPAGMTTTDFFAAARRIGACPKVAAVDLAEFDPALDVSDTTALVAARWLAEILAGFAARKG